MLRQAQAQSSHQVTISDKALKALLALLDKESRECSLNEGEIEALKILKGVQK